MKKYEPGTKIVILELDESDAWSSFKEIIGRVVTVAESVNTGMVWVWITNFHGQEKEKLLLLTKARVRKATKAELLVDGY